MTTEKFQHIEKAYHKISDKFKTACELLDEKSQKVNESKE